MVLVNGIVSPASSRLRTKKISLHIEILLTTVEVAAEVVAVTAVAVELMAVAVTAVEDTKE